jgi:TolC family type I secretion outer membrane protein
MLFTIWLLNSVLFCFDPSTASAGATPEDSFSVDWETVDVLDLETSQRIALADNPSIAAAQDRVRQAMQRVKQARSAYWPTLDASASYSRISLPESSLQGPQIPGAAPGIGTTSILEEPEDYFTLGLQANWLLFKGLERKYANASARAAERASREAEQDARRLLLSSVANSFYRAQLAREEIAIVQANEDFNQRQADEAKARRRVGTGSLSDVLNFQVQVNAAKSDLIQAKRSYEVAMFGLAALLGIPESTFPSGLELARLEPETAEELRAPTPEELVGYAKAHRTDILQARYAVDRAQQEIGRARAPFFPALNFSASLDGQRLGDTGFEDDDFGDTLALSLSYNLFSGGLDAARFREAKARRDEEKKNLANLTNSVVSEVRTAIAQVASAQEELNLQRSNAALVQQNRDLVEKEYAAGQGSLVRLNEAQRDLVTAQARLALALVSLRLAWHNLRTRTGEILVSASE